jgi:hypothetical protein
MTTIKMSNKKLALYIAAVYVILATIYIYWAMSNLIIDGVLHYIFLPVTLFPSLILFTEREPSLMILICQTITCFLIWPLVFLVVSLVRDDTKTKDIADN